jgi:hypothetical protein
VTSPYAVLAFVFGAVAVVAATFALVRSRRLRLGRYRAPDGSIINVRRDGVDQEQPRC